MLVALSITTPASDRRSELRIHKRDKKLLSSSRWRNWKFHPTEWIRNLLAYFSGHYLYDAASSEKKERRRDVPSSDETQSGEKISPLFSSVSCQVYVNAHKFIPHLLPVAHHSSKLSNLKAWTSLLNNNSNNKCFLIMSQSNYFITPTLSPSSSFRDSKLAFKRADHIGDRLTRDEARLYHWCMTTITNKMMLMMMMMTTVRGKSECKVEGFTCCLSKLICSCSTQLERLETWVENCL